MADLPPKLFFRIGEVAGLVGVEPHVLRYWEREFRTIRPTKSAKGQRVYSRKDVENLLRVRDLLYRDGFTIAGAKKRLHPSSLALASAPDDRDRTQEDEDRDPDPNRARENRDPDGIPTSGIATTHPLTLPPRESPSRHISRPAATVDPGPVPRPAFGGSAATVDPSLTPDRVSSPRREALLALRSDIVAFLSELSRR